MKFISARPADHIEEIIEKYGNMLFRICVVTLSNEADAEDALQEVFLKYITKTPLFNDSEHEKAWLIRVAVNQCRDILRRRKRHMEYENQSFNTVSPQHEDNYIVEALSSLPEKFKTVLILHYVEEYKVNDIAKIINKTPSAVKMRLQKGRKLLEDIYRKEYIE